jgi:hypothetical protein
VNYVYELVQRPFLSTFLPLPVHSLHFYEELARLGHRRVPCAFHFPNYGTVFFFSIKVESEIDMGPRVK